MDLYPFAAAAMALQTQNARDGFARHVMGKRTADPIMRDRIAARRRVGAARGR